MDGKISYTLHFDLIKNSGIKNLREYDYDLDKLKEILKKCFVVEITRRNKMTVFGINNRKRSKPSKESEKRAEIAFYYIKENIFGIKGENKVKRTKFKNKRRINIDQPVIYRRRENGQVVKKYSQEALLL